MQSSIPNANNKTREEYLLRFEERLLEILKDLFTSINHNFIVAYGLAALVAMVRWGAVSEISVLGSRLMLDGKGVLVIIALFVSAIYILINFQLIRIAEIFRKLNENGREFSNIEFQCVANNCDKRSFVFGRYYGSNFDFSQMAS